MKSYFDAQPEAWGISFAAPTSYWYLRWFDIGRMMQHVNWVNLMTYDLHGSWDNETSYIGPYAYAHTNLTEIETALDLLWRNGVDSSQVNLGIGFYGRSFQLDDPSCTTPGCLQKGPGNPGPCTGTGGYLSYAEIEAIREEYKLDSYHDEEAAVKYIAWGRDQWIAFDDRDTLKQKIDFASSKGLGGFMIWAVDLDTNKWDALDALLQPDGLGKFADVNGVRGQVGFGEWQEQGAQCHLGECSANPTCRSGYISQKQSIRCSGNARERRHICCDIGAAPDPDTCRWVGTLGILTGFTCNLKCSDSEILVVESGWYYEEEEGGSGDAACLLGGEAKYCCEKVCPLPIVLQEQESIGGRELGANSVSHLD